MLTPAGNILSLIPQRPPFVMIDQLTWSDETCSRSELLVQAENIFVVNGELREPGLVENIAQTAAARAGFNALREDKPVQVGYIGAIKNLEVFALPQINDRIETEVAIINQVFDVTVISGKVTCGNNVLAQCEMKIFIVPEKNNNNQKQSL